MAENEYVKSSILLVDDDDASRTIVSQRLEQQGYRVETAVSGSEALFLCELYAFDLILLDVMMEDMDGYEVARSLKKNPDLSGIPIIFLTGRDDDESIQQAFAIGAVDYIKKPFRMNELLARVKTHIQLRATINLLNSEIKKRNLIEEQLNRSLEDLRFAQEELIRLERMNTALAMGTTANHELNQPLMALKGFLDLLFGILDPILVEEEHKTILNQVQVAMDRIQSILKKYRETAEIELSTYHETEKMVVWKESDKKNEK
jgi:DNA-binding response OmpR family regulator